jgi:hypothetical protein
MIIKILFEDTELHHSYERVHQPPGGCALAAAAIASADVEVIGELIHLISPLLEGSVKSLGCARLIGPARIRRYSPAARAMSWPKFAVWGIAAKEPIKQSAFNRMQCSYCVLR